MFVQIMGNEWDALFMFWLLAVCWSCAAVLMLGILVELFVGEGTLVRWFSYLF